MFRVEEAQIRVADPPHAGAQRAESDHAEPRSHPRPPHPADGRAHRARRRSSPRFRSPEVTARSRTRSGRSCAPLRSPRRRRRQSPRAPQAPMPTAAAGRRQRALQSRTPRTRAPKRRSACRPRTHSSAAATLFLLRSCAGSKPAPQFRRGRPGSRRSRRPPPRRRRAARPAIFAAGSPTVQATA
jgi:hypothetical protein